MKKETNINLNDVYGNAFSRVVDSLAEECQNVIEETRNWGDFGETKRQSGEVVDGGKRNIVDTGELRDSQHVERIDNTVANIVYDAPYAVFVYGGYTTKSGTRVPGRRWGKVAADRLNLDQAMKREVENEL